MALGCTPSIEPWAARVRRAKFAAESTWGPLTATISLRAGRGSVTTSAMNVTTSLISAGAINMLGRIVSGPLVTR